ncbi:TAXI family TRAP transporter solute-binding subunit [Actinomadura sp. HBU206391]|uniref:TAXI family TRAP transporter solute-binding subunit n=1 Tax=Actinomadura sp. HBU206391 TaxID=2731692 RepID=UPI00164F7AD2|nr:TAXI family TRAP transporter solute-binding subunit [Actinomadura sp. HBU206391]MBC6459866.1 TAXI family TRAP transporter solute-binding subunit [Actinomadura sp. HBU206391]
MKRLTAMLLAAALTLVACGQQGTRLSIATGGTTGVYYIYGGGLAKLISGGLDNTEATASATSASVDNIKLVASGRADIAFSLADSAADAVQGKESFGSPQPVRALARIYDNYTQLAVTKGSGVKKVADLKGKRVSVGAPNSGTLVIAQRMLTAAGIDPASGIKAQQLGINESVQAMKDGTIDAFFWSGGVPTAGVTDLTSTKKDVALVDTTDLLPALTQRYGPAYREITISGAAYGLPADIKTVGVANFLLVSDKMSDDLAHDITRLLFDKKAELVRVHPEAENLDKQLAQQVTPVQLHPGAQRYYSGG